MGWTTYQRVQDFFHQQYHHQQQQITPQPWTKWTWRAVATLSISYSSPSWPIDWSLSFSAVVFRKFLCERTCDTHYTLANTKHNFWQVWSLKLRGRFFWWGANTFHTAGGTQLWIHFIQASAKYSNSSMLGIPLPCDTKKKELSHK